MFFLVFCSLSSGNDDNSEDVSAWMVLSDPVRFSAFSGTGESMKVFRNVLSIWHNKLYSSEFGVETVRSLSSITSGGMFRDDLSSGGFASKWISLLSSSTSSSGSSFRFEASL